MPRTWTPPLSAAVLFPFLSVSDFFESKEEECISTVLTEILGLKGTFKGLMGQLLSSYHYWLLLILIVLGGFGGSLFLNKSRSPGDSEWNFFLIRNTHNTYQDTIGQVFA